MLGRSVVLALVPPVLKACHSLLLLNTLR